MLMIPVFIIAGWGIGSAYIHWDWGIFYQEWTNKLIFNNNKLVLWYLQKNKVNTNLLFFGNLETGFGNHSTSIVQSLQGKPSTWDKFLDHGGSRVTFISKPGKADYKDGNAKSFRTFIQPSSQRRWRKWYKGRFGKDPWRWLVYIQWACLHSRQILWFGTIISDGEKNQEVTRQQRGGALGAFLEIQGAFDCILSCSSLLRP